MPLTDEQAFKADFLMKCAEKGMTIAETKLRVKAAIAAIRARQEKKALWPLLAGAASLLPGAASALTAAAIGVPIAAGAGTGYLAAKATSGGSGNAVSEAKQDEVMGEYQRLADEARRRTRLKKLQSMTGQRVIALTPGES